jgi:hypothetical protein
VGILPADLQFAQGRRWIDRSANASAPRTDVNQGAGRRILLSIEQGTARSTRSRAVIGPSECWTASCFHASLVGSTILIFIRLRGPFDVLDFVLFFQGVFQGFVD